MSAGLICSTGDVIRISDLLLTVPLKVGARWVEPNAGAVEQPISVSISIFHDVSPAARTDDLSLSLDYFSIAENIRNATQNESSFSGLRDVSRHISNVLSNTLVGMEVSVHVKVVQLKSALHTKTVGFEHLAKFRSDGSWIPARIVHSVEDLLCPAIIGVNSQERVEKQDVVVNLEIESGQYGFEGEAIDFRLITKALYDEITSSGFQTLEALTSFVASKTLSLLPLYDSPPTVLVRVAKPSALVFANQAEVQLRRTLKDFPIMSTSTIQTKTKFDDMETSQPHIVAIALGSNLGDTFSNIEHALRWLENPLELSSHDDAYGPLAFVHVVDTSFLYESKPMYVENQPGFVNGACIVETNLLPDLLLRLLKAIEVKVGRVPSIRNGPRAVDLDIIFYDNEIIDTRQDPGDFDNIEGELIVPHPRLQEREFVLRPLNDVIPDYVHPVLQKSVEKLLVEICGAKDDSSMKKVFPFPHRAVSSSSPDKANETTTCYYYSSDNLPHTEQQSTTQIMATVNATPDSFSDGGVHDTISAALSYISRSVLAGATIVDIGGYSTRPGAAFVSVEDEINRVVPIIRAMRDRNSLERMTHDVGVGSAEEVLQRHIDTILTTPISIDTFRWQVAEAAIEAGAGCINDVYAFGGPDPWHNLSGGGEEEAMDEAAKNEYTFNMKAVARKHGVPVILMHSRGDAGSNKDYTTFGYAADGKGRGAVLEGVRIELGARVDLVTKGKGGVRRWLVIVDPGIGFSKSMEGNLELLRSAKEVVGYNMIGNPPLSRNPLRGFPLLIGTSKKSFLGEILAQQPAGRRTAPEDRKYATAVAVSCAVQQKAMVVRVHDVQDIMDVVKVTQALYF